MSHSLLTTEDTLWTWSLHMACPLACPLLLTWLCLTTTVCFLTLPVLTVRKRYITSEVAANFIEIFKITPTQILPAPCDFIVDDFRNRLKSAIDHVAPLTTKATKNKPIPPWRSTVLVKESKRQCRSAEGRWRKPKLTIHYEILRQQLKSHNNNIKQARREYFSKLITDHKNNPKFLFSTFNQF